MRIKPVIMSNIPYNNTNMIVKVDKKRNVFFTLYSSLIIRLVPHFNLYIILTKSIPDVNNITLSLIAESKVMS